MQLITINKNIMWNKQQKRREINWVEQGRSKECLGWKIRLER